MLRDINYNISLRFLSATIFIIAILLLATSAISYIYNEEFYLNYLLLASIYSAFAFILFKSIKKNIAKSLNIKDSFFLIILVWLTIPMFGMLPYYFFSPIDNITDALFESYSSFTTTGYTFLSDYENIPKSIMFWRTITQWLGGMGIIIFIIGLFPVFFEGKAKAFFSDLQDIELDPLQQRLSTTAKSVIVIYLIYTIIGLISFFIAGMNIFDSFVFSLTSISTGGGTVLNGNVSHLAIKYKVIITILMLIAGTNYFFILLSLRKIKSFLKKEELKTYFLIIFFAFIFVSILGIFQYKYSNIILFESLFNIVSFVSTTGFYSINEFNTSISFIWIIMFFLIFIGSSTGSSGGGINIYRILILGKMLLQYIKNSFHPNAVFNIHLDKKTVNQKITDTIVGFFILYILIFFIGTILLSFLNYDFKESITMCASSLSNTGPGVFLLNDGFSLTEMCNSSKYIVMALMIIGRVELFPFLIVFSKIFWR